MQGGILIATVNGARELAFSVGGLACLLFGGMILFSMLASRRDSASRSPRRRPAAGFGTVAGFLVTLAGGGLIALWAVGADWSLSSQGSASVASSSPLSASATQATVSSPRGTTAQTQSDTTPSPGTTAARPLTPEPSKTPTYTTRAAVSPPPSKPPSDTGHGGTVTTCYPTIDVPAIRVPGTHVPAQTIPATVIGGHAYPPVNLPAVDLPAVDLPASRLRGGCLDVPSSFALQKTTVRVGDYSALDPEYSQQLTESYWAAAPQGTSTPDPNAPGFGEVNAAGFPKNQYVRSYVRRDGTLVSGYWRNSPTDGLPTCRVITC